MRNANERTLDKVIYSRLAGLRLSEVDRQHAVNAMEQAERIADVYLWLKEKLSDIGHVFLKPSLRH